MWFLITNRTLKSYQLYGPFESADKADDLAEELLNRGRIRNWSVVVAQVPPRFENGMMHTTAEI